jgi:putative flippase GtrA
MKRFLSFAVVGIVNTAVDFGIYSALIVLLGSTPLIANAISYSCGIVTSFIGNRSLTFRGYQSPIRSLWLRFSVYYGGSLAGLLFASALIFVFTRWLDPVLAKALSVPLTMAFNYMIARQILSAPKLKN